MLDMLKDAINQPTNCTIFCITSPLGRIKSHGERIH